MRRPDFTLARARTIPYKRETTAFTADDDRWAIQSRHVFVDHRSATIYRGCLWGMMALGYYRDSVQMFRGADREKATSNRSVVRPCLHNKTSLCAVKTWIEQKWLF